MIKNIYARKDREIGLCVLEVALFRIGIKFNISAIKKRNSGELFLEQNARLCLAEQFRDSWKSRKYEATNVVYHNR